MRRSPSAALPQWETLPQGAQDSSSEAEGELDGEEDDELESLRGSSTRGLSFPKKRKDTFASIMAGRPQKRQKQAFEEGASGSQNKPKSTSTVQSSETRNTFISGSTYGSSIASSSRAPIQTSGSLADNGPSSSSSKPPPAPAAPSETPKNLDADQSTKLAKKSRASNVVASLDLDSDAEIEKLPPRPRFRHARKSIMNERMHYGVPFGGPRPTHEIIDKRPTLAKKARASNVIASVDLDSGSNAEAEEHHSRPRPFQVARKSTMGKRIQPATPRAKPRPTHEVIEILSTDEEVDVPAKATTSATPKTPTKIPIIKSSDSPVAVRTLPTSSQIPSGLSADQSWSRFADDLDRIASLQVETGAQDRVDSSSSSGPSTSALKSGKKSTNLEAPTAKDVQRRPVPRPLSPSKLRRSPAKEQTTLDGFISQAPTSRNKDKAISGASTSGATNMAVPSHDVDMRPLSVALGMEVPPSQVPLPRGRTQGRQQPTTPHVHRTIKRQPISPQMVPDPKSKQKATAHRSKNLADVIQQAGALNSLVASRRASGGRSSGRRSTSVPRRAGQRENQGFSADNVIDLTADTDDDEEPEAQPQAPQQESVVPPSQPSSSVKLSQKVLKGPSRSESNQKQVARSRPSSSTRAPGATAGATNLLSGDRSSAAPPRPRPLPAKTAVEPLPSAQSAIQEPRQGMVKPTAAKISTTQAPPRRSTSSTSQEKKGVSGTKDIGKTEMRPSSAPDSTATSVSTSLPKRSSAPLPAPTGPPSRHLSSASSASLRKTTSQPPRAAGDTVTGTDAEKTTEATGRKHATTSEGPREEAGPGSWDASESREAPPLTAGVDIESSPESGKPASDSDVEAAMEIDHILVVSRNASSELDDLTHALGSQSLDLERSPPIAKSTGTSSPSVVELPSGRTSRSSFGGLGPLSDFYGPDDADYEGDLVDKSASSPRTSPIPRTPSDTQAPTALPSGKTYGGFPAITWDDVRSNLRNTGFEVCYARDIPHGLQDYMNSLSEETRKLPGMRDVFRATILQNTVLDEPDAPPIEILNPIDDEANPPWEFYYSNKMWHTEGVPPPAVKSLVACDCFGTCDPRSKTCACLARQRQHTGDPNGDFVYDKAGRLKQDCPIFECNDLCGCDRDCRNRVVQNGRKVQVSIQKTAIKGWGVFAGPRRIPRGTFIGIYSGELLTEEQGHERGLIYNVFGRTYLFDLDFYHLRNGDPNWETKYVVDAYHAGNFTRFLNHSCDPNCRLYACYTNEGNIDKPLLVVFADRDIDPYEEICFNYGGGGDDSDDDEPKEGKADEDQEAARTDAIFQRCQCGTAKCTGKMF